MTIKIGDKVVVTGTDLDHHNFRAGTIVTVTYITTNGFLYAEGMCYDYDDIREQSLESKHYMIRKGYKIYPQEVA